MTKLARDVMTPDPACCTSSTSIDEVAKLMVQNDCGEIPVIDARDRVVGVAPTATSSAGSLRKERTRSAIPLTRA